VLATPLFELAEESSGKKRTNEQELEPHTGTLTFRKKPSKTARRTGWAGPVRWVPTGLSLRNELISGTVYEFRRGTPSADVVRSAA